MPHVYTEDQLAGQPAIGLFAELGWHFRRTRDLLLPRLLSGQVRLDGSIGIRPSSGAAQPA